ncbi:hypothetical protein BH09DEP1_BH09DEP1_1250 [soil metagenome]
MKALAIISLFLSASLLIAQEMPQLPEAPTPVATSIMEESQRVKASTEPHITPASDFALPTPPAMETPKTIEQIESQDAVDIGLSAEVRQKEAALLNRLLSDEYVLYTKTLKFHWNVQGIVFHDFHKAFKEQYEALFDIVDNVAERARALGEPAAGSLQEFGTLTRLKEINGQKLTAVQMVKELLADHEAIIRTLRANIDETAQLGDQGTSNFLQDLIMKHEKIAWMLRATAAQ